MKKWRFLALVVLSLMLWSGAAAASVLDRYTAITTTSGDRVFALRARAAPLTSEPWITWHASEIVEVGVNLNILNTIPLGEAAKNSTSLAYHNGKLYVGSAGGTLWPNVEWGNVWEVDINSGIGRRIFNVENIAAQLQPYTGRAGISGLAIANDGTAFLLVTGHDSSLDFGATLFVTTVTALAAGNAGTPTTLSGNAFGAAWGLAWSEYDQTLWIMAGSDLQSYSKLGTVVTHRRTFSSGALGHDVYRIAPLRGGGLFYTTSEFAGGHTNGIAGLITNDAVSWRGEPNNGDAWTFAFRDHHNRSRVLVAQHRFGALVSDTVSVYDPGNLTAGPIEQVSNWMHGGRTASFIQGITVRGNYLYYATLESNFPGNTERLSGLIGRVDMRTWDNDGNGGGNGGGSGCSVGFGAAILLLLAPIALIKYRKR